jgi:hypothetical protein
MLKTLMFLCFFFVTFNLILFRVQNDPYNRPGGEVVRFGLLAHGGAVDPRVLVETTVGKKVTPEALASSLVDEIKSRRDDLLQLSC